MKAKQEVREAFAQAVHSLEQGYKGSSLTDIFVLLDEETGELSIFDDEENCLVKRVIEEWSLSDQEESEYKNVLKTVVQEMEKEGKFSSLNIYTPFSINWVDADFTAREELLLIEDESIIRLEDNFLQRMDKEFNEFLENLLKD